MRLTIRAFGLDLLDVEITTEPTSPGLDDEDYSRDLSGGTTFASAMGFTAHTWSAHTKSTCRIGTGEP
jgi:hypothetical protein